jgi:hypothetical protein|tara:strand:+ start:34438 stop:34611 length:174 start_codon:yes stop_codon:yes gene_type:complete
MFFRMSAKPETPEENIIGLITKNQGSLRAYIYTLLPDPALDRRHPSGNESRHLEESH